MNLERSNDLRERERGVLLGAHIYTDLGELEMMVMITYV